MKSFFRLLLFVSLIFIVGCTITKRRYTGGYYINWHNKAPDARIIAQRKATQIALNKIARPNSSSKKIIIPQKTVNPVNQKLVKVVTGNLQEKLLTNSFLYNLLPKSVSRSNIVAPSDTVTGHHQSEKDTTKRDVRLSWLFCLLGGGAGLLLILIFFSVYQTDPGMYIYLLAGLLLFLPVILFIVSLINSFKAMKGGYNSGLFLIVLLDIASLLFLLSLIFIFIFFDFI